jgi:putative peptidoglycan lipid II flippase
LYEHGKFTAADTSATAQALIFFLAGVPFAGGLRNIASAYYAFKDARTPMYASLVSIAVNIILNLALMWLIGFRAFPLSTSIAAFVNIGILFVLLPGKIGRFEVMPLLKYFSLMVAASAIGGFAGMSAGRFLLYLLGQAFIGQLLALLLSLVIACLVFYISSHLIGLKEVVEYSKRMLRRHKSSKTITEV